MATLWQVNSCKVPLLMKQLNGKPLTTNPSEVMRDWATYKPNNREFYRRRWHHPILATVIFWTVIWAFAIWISCR